MEFFKFHELTNKYKKSYCRFWYVDIIENYVRFYIIVALCWLE
jgi:hypothetical protein